MPSSLEKRILMNLRWAHQPKTRRTFPHTIHGISNVSPGVLPAAQLQLCLLASLLSLQEAIPVDQFDNQQVLQALLASNPPMAASLAMASLHSALLLIKLDLWLDLLQMLLE